MTDALVHEVFSSIQGEGPWVGQRHIFVRFQGCDLRCRFCDTPDAALTRPDKNQIRETFCSFQSRRGGTTIQEQIPNPVSPFRLAELCSRLVVPGPSTPVLSITGGEPLLQAPFLSHWLPEMKPDFRIYLETSGVHADAMKTVSELVDVVSMDFKLPSSTGLRPFWEEHRQFLQVSAGRELIVKAVVTRNTMRDDIITSARIIADLSPSVPFVLQPAGAPFAPASEQLLDFQDDALGILKDVRVIPQAHRILDVP